MIRTARTLPALLAMSLVAFAGTANAEMATTEDDNSRAVHVIQEPGASGERKQVALGAIKTDTKVVNSAELSLDLLPGLDVAVGTKVSFRVTAKKPGYLIVVDVDATGKLTQIYPYPGTMTADRPLAPNANYIRPGKPLQIPSPGDRHALEYVASLPAGVAMIVAILSDQPVQIIDLPDIPATLTGQAEALAFLTKFAKELRIPNANNGRLQEARWSFDAKFYAIR